MKYQIRIKEKIESFSLIEILIAVTLFMLIIGGVALFSIDAIRAAENASTRSKALMLTQENINAIILNKSDQWLNILQNDDGTPKHIELEGNQFILADGELEQDGVTTSIVIESARRDPSGNLTETGGTEDPHTKKVTVSASWSNTFGQTQSSSMSVFINDWNTKVWLETLDTDFADGMLDHTVVTKNNDGEVELEQVIYGDWCNPSITLTAYDLPGQGEAHSIKAGNGKIFTGTGDNSSGLSYLDILLDESDPPEVTVYGTFDGHKTNGVAGEEGYSYIATDTNSKEVVIINTTSSPPSFSEAGYYDAPGKGTAADVAVAGNVGYALVSTYLYTFDLSSKIGARPTLGVSGVLAGSATSIEVLNGYAYVTLDNTSTQMQILDVRNPSSISIVGQVRLPSGRGVDVSLNEEGTRAYLAIKGYESSGFTLPVFFIIDTSVKTGNRPEISRYETSALFTISGIEFINDERAAIVGSGGEEYQVLDIESEAEPAYCGGLEINDGINDITTAINSLGNAYSYLVTKESRGEFKAIKGGVGGGDENGDGYAMAGTYYSSVFDAETTTVTYYYLDWSGSVPDGTDAKFQIRAGNSPDLSASIWMGPDGTSNTYFTEKNGNDLPDQVNNNQYLQYKIDFTSDSISTPQVEFVQISYQGS